MATEEDVEAALRAIKDAVSDIKTNLDAFNQSFPEHITSLIYFVQPHLFTIAYYSPTLALQVVNGLHDHLKKLYYFTKGLSSNYGKYTKNYGTELTPEQKAFRRY